jgi:lipoprotein-releasing system permease protein
MATEKSDIRCLAALANCPDLLKRRTVDPRTAFYEDLLPDRDRALPPVAIGKEMARFFSLHPGDVLTVISPMGGGMGPTGPLPLSKRFRVAGIFFTGMYEYDLNYIYMSLADAQAFFSMSGTVSSLALKVDDIYDIDRIAADIRAAAGPGFTVKTWKEMNKNIFNALQMEKIVMFLILGFIVLVASFNIVSTLLMLVLGKTREIAILKAMGASDRSIMTLFVADGFVIGAVGTLLGLASGFGACVWLDGLELPFAQDVYYLTTLPVEMSAGLFALVAAAALAVSFAATLYPSRYAARIRPADGLRYE